MVLSRLNNDVSYPELKTLHSSDAHSDATIYQMELQGVDVLVACGNENDTFKQNNILYYPLYLVKSTDTVVQIGVYEIRASEVSKYTLDVDGIRELQADLIPYGPLLHSFATRAYLHEQRKIPSIPLHEQSQEKSSEMEPPEEDAVMDIEEWSSARVTYEIPEARRDIFTQLTNSVVALPPLTEESLEEAKQTRAKYQESSTDLWINKYMKNHDYNIIDNEGAGDCLFAAIRDAFISIGQETSVAKLRKKLAAYATEQTFQMYKERYEMHTAEKVRITKQLRDLVNRHNAVKAAFKNAIGREKRHQLAAEAKEVNKEVSKLGAEKAIADALAKEYAIVKNVRSLEEFRKQITTSDYWADPWAISTLERILNLKLIILSSDDYNKGNTDGVMRCGLLSEEMEQQGQFTPEFYIILEYTGNHYKLITYKKHRLFTFSELPYDIKRLIQLRCLEKNSGVFSIIPEFQTFIASESSESQAEQDLRETAILSSMTGGGSNPHDLYEDSVVLMFYSKSNDKSMPGRGAGEKMEEHRISEFAELAAIPQWRKKLSNFWMQPFMLDGRKWASVEHYYQGSKFKHAHPEFYLTFSLDSDSELSKNQYYAKAAGGKSGVYTFLDDDKHRKSIRLRPENIQIDADFVGGRDVQEMHKAQHAKFTQNPDLKELLLATNSAKLTHYRRNKEPAVFHGLMLIRDQLRREMMDLA